MSIIHCEENSIRGRKARMVELAGMLDNFPPRDMDEELCDWIIKQIRKDES